VKSGLEDVNVAAATSQFTEVETALQAAFETTTRLEGKTLFDYIS
jgi:flagellin-like hook-associated protein FlgL